MIGKVVDGRYEITRQLGLGGMGAVYEATHLGTGRRVAVKMILDQALTNPEIVARFQREARAAGAIDTEHIVQVIDMGTDRDTGAPFMAMEYLKGEDAQSLLARLGPLPSEVALAIAAQACVGLGKAHDVGIIHRDVKPANIFLAQRDGGDVVVKVLDFGIAKVKLDQQLGASGDRALTRTGSMLGSPVYMSPEQARGEKAIDHRSDLWSLGVVLYELLCGRAPHADQETLGSLIISICSGPPPSVQSYAPWIAPEVATVVHGALALRPADRFQTASEMLDVIRPLLPQGFGLNLAKLVGVSGEGRSLVAVKIDTSSVTASKLSGSQSGMSVAASTGDSPTLLAAGNEPKKSRRGLLIGAGLLVVSAAAAGGFVVLGNENPTAEMTESVPSAPPSALGASAEPVPSSAAPSVSVLPASSPTTEARSVRLEIVPPTAAVEVDGAAVDVLDGGVEIRGAPGSKHRVRIHQGDLDNVSDVVVTETGAEPNRVELPTRVATRPPGKPPPSPPPASAKRPATAAPAGAATKPGSPGISTKFE